MRKLRIYLSRKMGGRPSLEVLKEGWDIWTLCDQLGMEAVDPAHGEGLSETMEPITLNADYNTMKRYVAKDDYALSTCDVYLCCTGDTPSDGAWDEKGQAQYKLKIPVVLIAPKRASGQLMGYANIKADAIFATAEEAVAFIADHYKGGFDAIHRA